MAHQTHERFEEPMKNPRPWLRYIEAGDDLIPNGGVASAAAEPNPASESKGPSDDDALGDSGRRALVSERTARKAAEKAAAEQAQTHKDQMAAIAKALGVTADSGTGDDILQSLQAQVQNLLRQKEVETLARQKGITDDGDIALLSAIENADARAKLADRLAAPKLDQRNPKPDMRQGSGDKGGASQAQAGLDEAARRFGSKK